MAWWTKNMKGKLNLLISILAIFCFISMYMPVIQPRYPAGEYYAPEGSYNQEYYYTGDYYYAREYWDMTRYVFADHSIVFRVVFSLDQALLLLWALMSVKGEAGKSGLAAAVFNLLVVALVLGRMIGVMGSCRWGVLVIIVLDTLASVMLAWQAGPLSLGKGRYNKYITKDI